MLQNTFDYLETVPNRKQSDDAVQKISASLKLQDLILMVRRRVLQCYSKLISCSPHASGEVLTQSNLLTFAVTLFADPESYAPGTLSSSLANAAGTFESIWEVSDNSGFGITGLVRSSIIMNLPSEQSNAPQSHRVDRGDEASDIDEAVCWTPTQCSLFTDVLSCLVQSVGHKNTTQSASIQVITTTSTTYRTLLQQK